ncbi:MAG: hypothetical protein M1834_007355 [Cirrosporium novae-zelandiae]|nr:MAG: hypothetical protein M1834_007355 [Cirrosporium novae-zelandiae]
MEEYKNRAIPLPPPTSIPPQVLEVDKATPDAHVPRDPRLIRLTGVHPFNVEAPLSELFNEGFLTSPELFYVRNHRAVPQVADEEILNWELTVEGLVEKPMILTLKQLISDYNQVTYPVTLVCAGNRRKEQNQVRKSKGFSWGAAGVSTALWTGVIMADVIRKAKPKRTAKYVCMEGADKLPNGYYGTSVRLNWILDSNRGMMLAYKMNGEMLRPDHGKPLRAVIPGQIGGRSVKWIKRLILTGTPSDSWYHIYDNRVLPTMVSPEESANNPKWWMDDRYAIYDLSTNSVIAYPAHEERLCLLNGPEKYSTRGYAYGGGGRRITRVELSLDKGRTWRLADIDYAEDRYREVEQDLYGGQLDMWWRESCFCWCFWSLDISTLELRNSKDLLVRAMDESMNIQPRDMYWSVLGMMNNNWFRVMITHEGDYLRFEHPTQPALQPGGWMEKVKGAGGDLTNGYWGERTGTGYSEAPAAEEVKMTKDDINRSITLDELRKHDIAEQPWFVLDGEVYDGTTFLKEHPGGAQSIVSAAGTDATEEFMATHSETAKAMMSAYHIGTIDKATKNILGEGEVQRDGSSEKRPVFLNSRMWAKAILIEKKIISWNARIFKFKLQHENQLLGLPVGQHLLVRLRDSVTGEVIVRSYTPISETSKKGYLDILVKVYFDTKEARGGKMSKALDALPTGHSVDFKGPIGKFEYKGQGDCLINGDHIHPESFIMICAGSGITPIFQVFRKVMQNPSDKTRCIVFYGNRLVEDILCKKDLDALTLGQEEKGKIIHTLTRGGDDWKGLRGRISGRMVEEYCERNDETLVLLCGPEALETSMRIALKEQGWRDEQLLFF